MPLAKKRHAYTDVARVLDTAIAEGGLIFRPQSSSGEFSPGAATYFMQRAWALRNIIREENGGACSYDILNWRRHCGCPRRQCRHPDACLGNAVEITIGSAIKGEMIRLDGTPMNEPRTFYEVDDGLAEALAVRRELGLDEE